tara:strand:- start:1287 stop:1496 length:210 start_codon:yes stop_codon:yes gene_type:complete
MKPIKKNKKTDKETALEKRQKKVFNKAQEAFKEGKKDKGLRLLRKTAKQQDKMEKRDKGEKGIYPIISG